jgi:GNAT superfamily N-acetyltransferase
MTEPATRIRSATIDEIPQAVSAIVAAFLTDPPARFAWPSPHDYLRAMPQATREFAGSCFAHGTAYVSDDLRAAALWLPPGVEPDNAALGKMFRETASAGHLEDLLATFAEMERSHPKEPHWYLPQIGVDPLAQGQGLGAALMRHALARCDEDGRPAYLEASKPENVPFYARHGFEVTGDIRVGAAPPLTPMVRRPGAGGGRRPASS